MYRINSLIAVALVVITLEANPTSVDRELSFKLSIPAGRYVYQDLLRFRFDNPGISLIRWHATPSPYNHYDEYFKETKKVFQNEVHFTVMIKVSDEQLLDTAKLHLIYYQSVGQEPHEIIVPLARSKDSYDESLVHQINKAPQEPLVVVPPLPSSGGSSALLSLRSSESISWSQYIMELIQQEHPLWLRLIFVFLLGFLLSLTPCMYPMIPITIGILQAQGTKSLGGNVMRALLYVLGLSTTFALFGLLASCVGPVCGKFLSTPFLVLFLVALLAYFAFSMLGLYEIRLPKFLQKNIAIRDGVEERSISRSMVTAYLIGAASGTFASPCVSPGLALLLAIVATLGNQLLGFLFLFVFGVGLGIPLLIIGTISSSAILLPRAGVWMMEIKRLFGLMMLGACAYYATYAVPPKFLYWIFVVTLIFLALFYLVISNRLSRSVWATINRGIATILIASACVMAFYAFRESFLVPLVSSSKESLLWHISYDNAAHQAQQERKLMFIDFWAPYCPVCISINKKILAHEEVLNVLSSCAVLVKLDVSKKDDSSEQLQKELDIIGVPAFMIIDAKTHQVYKRWGAEISSMPIGQFITEIKQACIKH